jgi:hypothetical protein
MKYKLYRTRILKHQMEHFNFPLDKTKTFTHLIRIKVNHNGELYGHSPIAIYPHQLKLVVKKMLNSIERLIKKNEAKNKKRNEALYKAIKERSKESF